MSPALQPDEAEALFERAVALLEALDEDPDIPRHRAVPRNIMDRGEAMRMIGALIALIVEAHPHVPSSEGVLDLAASYYREAQ